MNNISDMNAAIHEYHRMNHILNLKGWRQERTSKKQYFSPWFAKNL